MRLTPILATTSAVAVALPMAASAQSFETEVMTLPEWQQDYDALHEGVSIDSLLEADVVGREGEDIGDVENVVFDEAGNVASLIAEVGGFLELGDTHISVPWSEVSVGDDDDMVAVPVTEESVGDYSLFADDGVPADQAGEEVRQVEGHNVGLVETGPRAWRATEFIGDYARIREGEGYANYGYVYDLIVQDGAIASVVVRPDVTWAGGRGDFAFPYYGYDYGWNPGSEYYDIPYDEGQVAQIEALDYGRFDGP